MSLKPNFFLNLSPSKRRSLVAVAGTAGVYGIMYVMSPDILLKFNLNQVIANPLTIVKPELIAPPIIAGVGVLIPKFIKKPNFGSLRRPKAEKNDKVSPSQVQATFSQTAQSPAAASPSVTSTQSGTPAAQPSQANIVSPTITTTIPGQTASPVPDAKPTMAEQAKLTEVVEKKLAPVTEEILSMKSEITSFKKDIEELKGGVKEITSSFENSLVELKAFQAEMVNPINFMRKYFETMDIKSLSDPVNAIKPIEQLGTSNSKSSPNTEQSPQSKQTGTSQSNQERREAISLEHVSTDAAIRRVPSDDGSEVDFSQPVSPHFEKIQKIQNRHESEEPLPEFTNLARQSRLLGPDTRPQNSRSLSSTRYPSNNAGDIFKSSIERGLTPGKIMSIVGIVDEVLATMGPDGIDLIVEQYRNIGLKAEEERLIYGVLKMLNESKMLPDDIIAMLYRFGQVLGINDEEAELQYTRLIASRKNRKGSLSGRSKVGERAA